MDESTVLDYPDLPAERLEYCRSARSASGPCVRPMMNYLKMLLSDKRTFKSALDVGLQHLGWTRGRTAHEAAVDQAKRQGACRRSLHGCSGAGLERVERSKCWFRSVTHVGGGSHREFARESYQRALRRSQGAGRLAPARSLASR